MKRLGGGGSRRRRAWGEIKCVLQCLPVLAVALAPHAKAGTFTLLSADQSAWVEEDQGYHWAHEGETFDKPSRLRTDTRGRLTLASDKLRIKLPERSELTIDTHAPPIPIGHLKNFTAPWTRPRMARPSNGLTITLHRGTIFVQTADQSISVHARNVRADAHNATFALSTSYSLGQQISVVDGNVKVRNTDRSILLLSSGNSLRTGEGRIPSPPALEPTPEMAVHWEDLRVFEQECSHPTPNGPNPMEPAEFAKSPRALKEKRQAEAPQ